MMAVLLIKRTNPEFRSNFSRRQASLLSIDDQWKNEKMKKKKNENVYFPKIYIEFLTKCITSCKYIRYSLSPKSFLYGIWKDFVYTFRNSLKIIKIFHVSSKNNETYIWNDALLHSP